MEEYVFPENNWYIEITDENKEVLNAWKITKEYSTPIDNYLTKINYINYMGSAGGGGQGGWWRVPPWNLITFEQFQKYVLGYKIIEENTNQDYTYLIDMLNK